MTTTTSTSTSTTTTAAETTTPRRTSSEARMVFYCLSLYAIFITWGYLQEKITSSEYVVQGSSLSLRWDYPAVLNLCMSVLAAISAWTVERILNNSTPGVHLTMFWRSAFSSALASPIGYRALRHMSYPMMVLTKSSKQVPVMVVGGVFYKQTYAWFQYASVLLVCGGISLFSYGKASVSPVAAETEEQAAESAIDMRALGVGLTLVLLNLSLDGVTNNEQDRIFRTHRATSMQMMKFLNVWQAIYLFLYLVADWAWYGEQSKASCALAMMRLAPAVAWDIALFCLCGCAGQILMFGLIKEFGSLVWITVSITRQLFTILLSVFVFQHTMRSSQWIGLALVFFGLGLEIVFRYRTKTKDKDLKQS